MLQVAISKYIEIFVHFNDNDRIIIWLPSIISIIIQAIYAAGLIFLFSSIIRESYLSPKECIIRGIWYSPLYIVTDFIVKLLTIAGFLLLIVPGIILLVRLSLSQFFLLLFDDMPFKAIEHSFKKTKGFTNDILCTIFVSAIPLIIIVFLSIYLRYPTNLYGHILSVLIDIFTGFYSVLFIIILFRYFCLIHET